MSGDQSLLKRLNRMAIVRQVKSRPGMARGELARLTGLADSTISVLVNELIEEGWIKASESAGGGGVGRRPKLLALDPDRIAILGAEVGVDYLNVVACSLRGQVLFSRMGDYQHGDVGRSVRDLAGLLAEARQAMAAAGRRLLGVGVGVPGMVAPGGLLRLAPAIGWRDVDFGGLLSEALHEPRRPDLQVTVLNDANAAALSEYVFGASLTVRSLIFLSLGYGLGAGIVLDDQLQVGRDGGSGEVGHVILRPDGPPCACGRCGCAETLISQKEVSRLVTGLEAPVLHIGELLDRQERHDLALARAAREVGGHLGLVLHNLVVTINPELLVLGGPLSRLDGLVEAAQDGLRRYSGASPNHQVSARVCRLGLDACAVGAAGGVLNQLLQRGEAPPTRALA